MGDQREPTTSIPQSHPSDVTKPFKSLFGRCRKRVVLKFDTTRQLLEILQDRQKLSGSDAQNNGALPPPPRPPQEGLSRAGGYRSHLRGRPSLTRSDCRDSRTHAKQRAAHGFLRRRSTHSPEELDFILSFSAFSHGCKGARSAASAGSAPLSILAYS